MAYKLNGKTLQADRGFTHNGIQYPRNWLKLSTQADKDAIGITWEADPVRADDRYYWDGDVNNPKALDDVNEVDEDGSPIYVQEYDANTESMVDTTEQVVTKGLKSNMIQQVKHTAGTLLAQTDWYVTRKVERDKAIPADVVTQRQHIVTESDRLEVSIMSVVNVEELMDVMNSQDWEE